MSEPTDEKKAEWYFEMMKHSYATATRRRDLVWHLSIALWTVLGLLIISVLREDIRDKWTLTFGGSLLCIHLVIWLLYLAAVAALQRSDKSDSDYANDLQTALAAFISNPANGLRVVEMPCAHVCWCESVKRSLDNWASWIQLIVTTLLLVGSCAALSTVVS